MAEPVTLDWEHQYRIVSSEFPPINFFESLVDPELMDELFFIESLTNDRLRDEAGDIAMVAPRDRISGPGATPVMAAFTHIGAPSRFSDGSYGIYYAGDSLKTAITETRFHRERFLSHTNEDPGEVDMRAYIGDVLKPMQDIRSGYEDLLNPDITSWPAAQAFGLAQRDLQAWGIVYPSVRNPGGECIAALRPPAVSIPLQGPHLSYVWNGKEISQVYEKTLIL